MKDVLADGEAELQDTLLAQLLVTRSDENQLQRRAGLTFL